MNFFARYNKNIQCGIYLEKQNCFSVLWVLRYSHVKVHNTSGYSDRNAEYVCYFVCNFLSIVLYIKIPFETRHLADLSWRASSLEIALV